MKLKSIIYTILSVLIFASCDDNTSTLGVDMMPESDFMTSRCDSFDVTTASYPVGNSVLARTSMSYFGQFTDPETGTIVISDFLAQFHCNEYFAFPEKVTDDKITKAEITLYVEKFVGDSLTSFKLSVYPLNKVLDPEENYYTNIDPTLYYDTNSEPIAVKWFTLSDRTTADEDRWDSEYYNHINISLPASLGQAIYDGYKQDPEVFANTSTWANSDIPGSKGFYFKLESGDGAMAYIDIAQLNLHFNYYDSAYEKDTAGVCQFAATEEVIQANRFTNSNLEVLLEDNTGTYIKSPAGIFTVATLPIAKIMEETVNDTINSAKISFVRYNDKTESKFKLEIPQKLLMVRLDDYNNGFFEKYSLVDNKTSYIATFNSQKNTYEFSNIAKMLSACISEKKDGTASANWDKVLIIPVDATYDSSNILVKLSHDFSMSSSKLVGGKDAVALEIIHSHFNQ
jgi:hypothetical protein